MILVGSVIALSIYHEINPSSFADHVDGPSPINCSRS